MAVRSKEEIQRDRVLSEVGMKKVPVEREADGEDGAASKQKRKQQMKVVRQSFAVGGLDQDYVDWGMGSAGSASAQGGSKGGMTKGQIRQAAHEKPFSDFDATKKLRKGGKLGHNSFKSKSKYKRR